EEDEKKFFSLFAPVSDSIGIERAGPIYRGVPMNAELAVGDTTQYGGAVQEVKICPQPFTSLQVAPDGNVTPCYSIEYPVILGNVREKSLYSIWHGGVLKKFRQRMLNGRMSASFTCSVCNIIRHRMSPEDSLDNARDRLKEVFGC
ncbi:MAG TPA: SPASM domain-containing protein, partial [Candidatus Krumholzibacterium sp.]|nr:SPASM domain-containing protein [Candidatus Krumholzibacterium sp.]